MYFGENTIYDDKDFERVFRKLYALFERIYDKMTGCYILSYRKDDTEKDEYIQECELSQHCASYRMERSIDEMEELCDMFYNRLLKSSYAFIDTIIEQFGAKYLCAPCEEVLRRILGINAGRGFSGCAGS